MTLLLVEGEPGKYERAAARWHLRFAQEVPHVDLRESQAVLALLTAIPANRLAAAALAELLSRRRSCERIAESLVRWSRFNNNYVLRLTAVDEPCAVRRTILEGDWKFLD